MGHIIGLNSVSIDQKTQFLEVDQLDFETVFAIDRTIRAVSATSPLDSFEPIATQLAKINIKPLGDDLQGESVYMHSRPWNEGLNKTNQSFFVTFTEESPDLLAGKVFLASNYPAHYAMVATEYLSHNHFIILTGDHDPIYPDDLIFLSGDKLELPIGQIEVIKDQFHTDDAYEVARQQLITSGYDVI